MDIRYSTGKEPFSSLILTCTDINVLTLPLGVKYVYATTAHGRRFFSRIARLKKTMTAFKKIADDLKDSTITEENPIVAEILKNER